MQRRATIVLLTLAVLSLRDPVAARRKKPRPTPCSGRFVLDAPLAVGGSVVADAIEITDTSVILPGCGEATATLNATRKATTVRARWSTCEALGGPVTYRGKIIAACARLKGAVVARRARPRNHPLSGHLSSCGDGVVDAGRGEQCDGAAGCAAGIACSKSCWCREPGRSVYNVTYTPETAVIPESVVDQKLLRTEDARYVFASSATEIQALTPGRVMLLSGLALRRVTGVQTVGSEIRVDTEAANLNDAIADGVVEWDHPFELDAARANLAVAMHRRGALRGFDEGTTFEADGPNLHYEGTIAGVSVSLTLSPGDERIDIDAEFSKGDGALGFKCTAKGWVRGARILGRVLYERRVLRDMRLDLSGLEGEVTLGVTAVRINSDKLKLAVPLSFPFPIMVGPVPVVVTIGANANVVPVLAPNASSDMEYKVTFSMDQGVHLEAGTPQPLGILRNEGLTLERATTAGLIPVAMAFGLELPSARVSVFQNAVAFAALITSIQGYLQPLISQPCQDSGAVIRGVLGFNVSFLGLNRSGEKELFKKERFTHRIGTDVFPGHCP
ncbi:MAG: hypothetical protein U0807_05570 [Candidatus Binatia bacterium]